MSGIEEMKKYPQAIREKTVQKYKNGVSQSEISKTYNVSRYTLQS